MSIGVISLNLTAILLLISAIPVFFSYRKERTIFLRDFSVFLFSIAGASICYAIDSWLVLMNSKLAGWFYPLAATIGGIGFLYFCHLVLTLTFPERVKRIITLLIFLYLILTPILWLNPPKPYLNEEGIIFWNIDLLSGFILAATGAFLLFYLQFCFFGLA